MDIDVKEAQQAVVESQDCADIQSLSLDELDSVSGGSMNAIWD